MGATAALAEFVAGLRFEALPAAAVHAAKRAILDTVGVTLAARGEPVAERIVRFVERVGGVSESTVLGYGSRTSAPNAALANGTLIHALDWDDNSIALNGHPSAVVLPPALALAESLGLGGRDLIVTYVAGFEVAARVGRMLGVGAYERGWHATGTAGALGAAAAASRTLGLDAATTATALSIGASHAAGLRQNFGTMTKPFHAGNAARSGTVAALLAADGFTADPEILEGRYGLLNAVGEADRSAERGLKGLGDRLHLLTSGIAVKVYPSCANSHHALDAVFALIEREDVRAEVVERVECAVPFRVPMVLVHERPTTALEGKFSMQYCVAAALLDRQLGLAQFTDEMVRRPEAQALFPRIEMVVPEAGRDPMARNFAEVSIYTRDGRTLRHRVDEALGTPRNPLTDAQLDAKFRLAAGTHLDPDSVERTLDIIRHLDRVEDLRTLVGAATIRGLTPQR